MEDNKDNNREVPYDGDLSNETSDTPTNLSLRHLTRTCAPAEQMNIQSMNTKDYNLQGFHAKENSMNGYINYLQDFGELDMNTCYLLSSSCGSGPCVQCTLFIKLCLL